jgi:hypothetical protein
LCACGATVRDDAKSLAAVVVAPVLAPATNGQSKRQAQPKQAKPKYGNNPAIASAGRRSYTDKTLKALLLENGPFCPRCKKQLIYTVARDDQENTNVADICHSCTMNSDMVPHEEFSDGFDIESYVRLRSRMLPLTKAGCSESASTSD